ncbi:MAG: SRPBCC family protein [Chloroflexi bacterium]|nr:SRPBCC family protein [Chloroflexota bacterium]OJV90182.1 MAG: polyketide cyclase [Chloroflexi bacterium 54-19]
MNERSVKHDTFVVERTYSAAPARVFAAWADPQIKAHWFPKAAEFEFQVGGREVNHGSHNGAVYTFDALYLDIIPGERIVYSYIMDRDQTRISASLATVEFKAAGKTTKLTYTEQGVYLDDEDKPQFRLEGMNILLDTLGQTFKAE